MAFVKVIQANVKCTLMWQYYFKRNSFTFSHSQRLYTVSDPDQQTNVICAFLNSSYRTVKKQPKVSLHIIGFVTMYCVRLSKSQDGIEA